MQDSCWFTAAKGCTPHPTEGRSPTEKSTVYYSRSAYPVLPVCSRRWSWWSWASLSPRSWRSFAPTTVVWRTHNPTLTRFGVWSAACWKSSLSDGGADRWECLANTLRNKCEGSSAKRHGSIEGRRFWEAPIDGCRTSCWRRSTASQRVRAFRCTFGRSLFGYPFGSAESTDSCSKDRCRCLARPHRASRSTRCYLQRPSTALHTAVRSKRIPWRSVR